MTKKALNKLVKLLALETLEENLSEGKVKILEDQEYLEDKS